MKYLFSSSNIELKPVSDTPPQIKAAIKLHKEKLDVKLVKSQSQKVRDILSNISINPKRSRKLNYNKTNR